MKRATKESGLKCYLLIISIHALVKRATKNGKFVEVKNNISIHALVKRATCGAKMDKENSKYFNPRPREEGDISRKRGF